MFIVPIKPLGVNSAYGHVGRRRYSTAAYKKFEKDCLFLLPKMNVPAGEIVVSFEFGFSNKAADVDGPIKTCLDILTKKYGFNDNIVYGLSAKKVIVKKGSEYWAFSLSRLE